MMYVYSESPGMQFSQERRHLFLVLALFFIGFIDLCESNTKLYLLDLFTCVDKYEDYSNQIPQLTVRAAIELANSRDDILPGYTLCTVNKSNEVTSILSDGKILMTSAVIGNFYKEFDAIMSQPNSTVSPVVLGSPFGFVNEYTVDILGSHQNFVQVNYKSTAANVSSSPFFYWIGPNQAFFNAVRLQLLVRNNWRRVSILSSLDEFSLTAEDLEKMLHGNDIAVINTESFTIEGGLNGNQLNSLKDKDIRIIIALITVIEVPLIMCTAHEIGLIDDRHVWILPQMNLNDIRRVAKQYNICDVDIVLRNALMVGESHHSFENHSLPFKESHVDDLLMEYTNLTSITELTEIPGYSLSKPVFDATWAAILALNNSIQLLSEKGWSLEESVNQNGVDKRISDVIKESFNKVKFLGLSGMVDFSDNFRMGNTCTSGSFCKAFISQIINNSSCIVEIYNSTGVISTSNSKFCDYTWGNDPPVSDGLIDHPHVPTAFLVFTIMVTVIFLFVAMATIIFSVLLRSHKYMKTSSVTVNVVVTVGCMVIFMGTLMILLTYGVKQYGISEGESTALCYVNLCMDHTGYTLFSIALLLKMWRLYRIKTNALLKKKLRFVSNKAMLIFAMILMSPVVLLISIQLIFDRPKLVTELLDIKGRYPYEHMKYTYCDQNWWYLWRMLLLIYDSGILVHTFQQAGHVSQMSIKRIAHEGDISLRLVVVTTVFLKSHVIIVVIVLLANYYYEATIIHILGSMTLAVVIMAMIFSPKVYVIINDYMQVRNRKRNSDFKCEAESTT